MGTQEVTQIAKLKLAWKVNSMDMVQNQNTVVTLLKRQGDSTRTVFSSATFKVTIHLRAGFRCIFVRQLRPQV